MEEDFIRGLPKAELHLHIEGTLEPEMMFALAERNGVELPFSSVDEVRAAYEFSDLQSFLDIYYQGAAVLLHERDFFELMAAYLERAHADVLRHLPGSSAVETWTQAFSYHDRILAVGLDSGEVGNPPELFAEAYRAARGAGLHAVAHAGEEGPPSYITGALDVLGAERIDHGVRCEEDPELVARLVAERVPLTMCPLSNVKLRVFDRLEDHSLKRLLDRGVVVMINSDDPAYFGGYIGANYIETARALSLSRDDLITLARNSLEATFVSPEEKAAMLARLDAYAAG
jgi:adenosine deaminase